MPQLSAGCLDLKGQIDHLLAKLGVLARQLPKLPTEILVNSLLTVAETVLAVRGVYLAGVPIPVCSKSFAMISSWANASAGADWRRQHRQCDNA
jgi:hypothetical protein